jgi:chemotaxis protein methyltransferase CheR
METAAALLTERIGFQPSGTSAGRLDRALREGSAESGRPVGDYVAALAGDAVAFQDFVDRVTVQETSFFRHPEQFAALEHTIIPALPDPVVIWSAGCANGQEAYSLAILLEEAGRPGHVIATDVSSRALQRTRAARYEEREMRGLSAERRARFLRPDGQGFAFRETVRKRVLVVRNNLAEDPPPFAPGACHLVLCRNVLIYFSRDEIHAFLRKVHAQLPAGGTLMIGGSEALWHVTDVFEVDRSSGVFLYRRGQRPTKIAKPVRVAARARAPRVPRAPRVQPVPAPDAHEVRAAADAASARGDWAAAVAAYRQVTYLAPDDVLAYVGLGVAMEADHQADGALRAYRAARAALTRVDHASLAVALDGYRAQDVEQLLASKLRDTA